jgi:hypothetical protein
VAVGFAIEGNHAQYTSTPQALFLILGWVFAVLHLMSLKLREASQSDAFSSITVTPYWITLIMDVGLTCFLGAASWGGLAYFNAQLDTAVVQEQGMKIVGLQPVHSHRYGSDMVRLGLAELATREMSIPVSHQVFERLELGQCYTARVHAGYFHWVWIERPQFMIPVACEGLTGPLQGSMKP